MNKKIQGSCWQYNIWNAPSIHALKVVSQKGMALYQSQPNYFISYQQIGQVKSEH